MSNSALRYFSALLALCYPVAAHLAVSRHSFPLTLTAIAVLAAALLVPSLLRGRLVAWLVACGVVAFLWWLARSQNNQLALFVPPVVVPAFLASVFGHTLAEGHTPLISQFIQALHTAPEPIEASVWSYARRLTWIWTLLMAGIAATNLLLATFAAPGGLLLLAGLTPPWSVSLATWSLFANLLGYLLVAALFVGEYAYRRRRFPQQPYRNFFVFLGRTLAAGPRLMGRG